MSKKYYTPRLEEFRIGFEYEWKDVHSLIWTRHIVTKDDLGCDTYGDYTEEYAFKQDFHEEDVIRVKYLDSSDIESCGFTYTDECTINNRDCYKLLPDKTIYQISPYFNFRHEERENLVRIYKGELHNYPYQEIFRGDIKNLSELHQVLDMIGVEYER